MNKKIENRVIEISKYILKTHDTIRDTAKKFSVSKSTVHKDIQERLKDIDATNYQKIMNIFETHIATRHILGGESTKLKYQKLKQVNGG